MGKTVTIFHNEAPDAGGRRLGWARGYSHEHPFTRVSQFDVDDQVFTENALNLTYEIGNADRPHRQLSCRACAVSVSRDVVQVGNDRFAVARFGVAYVDAIPGMTSNHVADRTSGRLFVSLQRATSLGASRSGTTGRRPAPGRLLCRRLLG
jgi:hypothetical protein